MATRPHLLYVVNGIPHVPAPGGPTRAFHLVRAAAEAGEVTLVAVVEGDATPDSAPIAECCDRIEFVPAPPPLAADSGPGLIGDAPSVLWRFDPRPLRAAVANLLRTQHVDLLIVEHTELAAALAPLQRQWGGPSLADLHNVLSVHQRR